MDSLETITISVALGVKVSGQSCVEEIIGPVSEGCRLHEVEIRTHTAVSST